MTNPTGCLRRLRGCESGAAAIEFAIIAMLLILVCLGTIEFGRAFFLRNELSFAADFAARKVLTDPTICEADLHTEVRSTFTGLDPDVVVLDFDIDTADGILFRTVEMEYPMTLLVPGLSDDPINLSLSRRIPTDLVSSTAILIC